MAERIVTVTCDQAGNAIAATPAGRELAIACAGEDGPSSVELLLAALGGCVTASIAPLLSRHGASVQELHVTVVAAETSLEHGVSVEIVLPAGGDALLARCRRAAANCPVKRSLGIPVTMHWRTR